MKYILASLLFTGILVAGCEKETPADAVDMIAGTLYDYTGLDGCSWVIQLADGTVLEPTNLDDFPITPENGKHIFLTYSPVNAGSICMVGEIVEIQSIRE